MQQLHHLKGDRGHTGRTRSVKVSHNTEGNDIKHRKGAASCLRDEANENGTTQKQRASNRLQPVVISCIYNYVRSMMHVTSLGLAARQY